MRRRASLALSAKTELRIGVSSPEPSVAASAAATVVNTVCVHEGASINIASATDRSCA